MNSCLVMKVFVITFFIVTHFIATELKKGEDTTSKEGSELAIPVVPTAPPSNSVAASTDRDISRVRSVLDTMVNKLKIQIDTTEKVI